MQFSQTDWLTLAWLVPAMAVFGFVALNRNWLTLGGALAAFLMGSIFFLGGGLKAFIAPGIFLCSGSLLAKLNEAGTDRNGRNATQVFANGATGILCLLVHAVYPQPVLPVAAVVSFSVAMADTCSSELGVYYKGKTFDLGRFRPTLSGISGGVSVAGTVAGLAGSTLLSAIVCLVYGWNISVFITITGFGFAGMLFDSLLGSWVQAKYQTAEGSITETRQPGSTRVNGQSWCDNDMVNLLSVLFVTGLFIFLFCTRIF